MSPRRSLKSRFDHLVDESKQITADLIALRRDAQRLADTRYSGASRLPQIADRAYLTLEATRALTSTLSDIWMDAAGLSKRQAEDDDEMLDGRRALTSGQLRLASGGKRQ